MKLLQEEISNDLEWSENFVSQLEEIFIFEGKEYTLEKHGFARFKTFCVESQTDTSAVFLHKSDAETKVKFPFDYELRVIYTLAEKTVKIEFSVVNKTDKTMYFNIGSHE